MYSATRLTHDDPTTKSTKDSHGFAWSGTFPGRKPRLLLLLNDEKYFHVHRLAHARAAREAGLEVVVSTRVEVDGKGIEQEGFRYLPNPFKRGIRPPFQDLSALAKLTKLYQREKPDIVHHFALKPVLYGSWAARQAGIPSVVNTFTGLGFAFMRNEWRSRLLRIGLTAGLRSALSIPNSRALFENAADRDRLIGAKVVRREQTALIKGTGIDIGRFHFTSEQESTPVVLLACRMLWDKGVGEFVQASKLLKEQHVSGRFVLVGTPDPDSPTTISEAQLLAWQQEGNVEWWGYRDDMPEILASAHVIVLPSYYEGFPRILQEACASGRPIVATSIPGCSEAVRHGENGFLIPPRDPVALAEAIKMLLENPDLRRRMGMCGREIALREFSSERVSGQVLALYHELLSAFPTA